MAQVILSEWVHDDFDRIFDFLFEHAPETAVERINAIIAAFDILESSPLVGRPVANGKRELMIGAGASGYVALYRFVPERNTVFVLAVRSQRELGFGKTL